jgi:hypothetical protein
MLAFSVPVGVSTSIKRTGSTGPNFLLSAILSNTFLLGW